MNRLSKAMIFVALLISMVQGIQANENSDYQAWKSQILSELDTSSDEETGDSTYAFGRDTPEVRIRVKVRTEEADSFIVNNSNDPVLWWIKGELGLLKQVFYHIDLKKGSRQSSHVAIENQALIKEYLPYYRKALDTDDAPDAPAHLDGKHLVKMTQDVLSPPDIKKRAARKALDISIAGGSPPYGGEVGSYELYMYQRLLGAYADAGDNQLYLDTVNEMIERFGSSDELLANKRDAEAFIAKQAREAAEGDDTYTQSTPR